MSKAQPWVAMQHVDEDAVRNWYSWAGGSARACLKNASKGADMLGDWMTSVSDSLAKATTEELLVSSLCHSSPTL